MARQRHARLTKRSALLKENCTMAIQDCNASTSLPEYVLERNQAALAAGLTIERQTTSRGYLKTWFRGSEAQWRRSPFCFRAKPFTKSGMGSWGDFEIFSADRHLRFDVKLRPEGDFRGSIPTEKLPTGTTHLGKGIVRYEMAKEQHRQRYGYLAYLGEPSALIDSKIAPPEILETDEMRDESSTTGYVPLIWQRSILPDGRYCFFDLAESERALCGSFARPLIGPHDIPEKSWERLAAERAAEYIDDTSYTDPEQFAEACEDFLEAITTAMVNAMSGDLQRRNHGKCTVRYDQQTTTKVKDALEHACQLLQSNAPGLVGSKVSICNQLSITRANPDFQRFLTKLIGPDTAAGRRAN